MAGNRCYGVSMVTRSTMPMLFEISSAHWDRSFSDFGYALIYLLKYQLILFIAIVAFFLQRSRFAAAQRIRIYLISLFSFSALSVLLPLFFLASLFFPFYLFSFSFLFGALIFFESDFSR